MEFNYNLNDTFSSYISKINHTLLPTDFKGDKRNAINSAAQVADIIDTMGYASAKAQSLQHPITSADKMRNGEHILYLMIDLNDNSGKGSVVGLLKMGIKNLFLFDEVGKVHEKKCLCVLDFYVHESKQRTGYGKKLYDYMLNDKGIEPNKLAIDKPSEKFLSFLFKHYGLSKIYPQNNNFVLFEGFFDPEADVNIYLESLDKSNQTEYQTGTSSEYGDLHKDHNSSEDNFVMSDVYKPTSFGRHTAFKHHDTMGKYLEWHSPPQEERHHSHMNDHSALW